MDKKSLNKLELNKIINMLQDFCMSDIGRSFAIDTSPMLHSLEINNALDETCEAYDYLSSGQRNPIRLFDEVASICNRAKIGAVLHGGSLLSIASFLGVSREVKASIESAEAPLPILKSYADLLIVERFVENQIKRCILSEDEMADDASPELYSIRKKIKLKQGQIREKMNAMLRTSSKYLQESIITLRDGRYVLPVRAEYKNEVKGVIHDVSSSGSTVFVEPLAVVTLNNEIKTLEGEEQNEIRKILKDLSALVGKNAEFISAAYDTLGKLDYIFAKAKLAIEMDAIRPLINEENYINIVKGRHPLIDKKEVVPVTIWCGKDFDCLIVTGPNTGGKTVSLKTCGLFILMAQCGLLVPADDGTTLPIFNNVYADIGDEQSIEQSLSTFSSHMKNIVTILKDADHKSLVLLDELGAGTDPTEGAALAISILENLLSLGATVFATTHYSELKAFALTSDRVENAAMEFNVETLSPTYKMGIGIPGKSNAFEISRRLGLDEDIIKNARHHITDDGVKFEDIIQSAERNRMTSLKLRKEAESYHEDAKKLLNRSENDWQKITATQQKEIEKAKIEANRILQEAKDEANKVIKKLKDLEKGSYSNLDRERQQINDSLKIKEGSKFIERKTAKDKLNPNEIKPGQSVRLIDTNTKATILKKPDNKGKVQVQAGILKLTTNLSNLEAIAPPKPKNTYSRGGGGLKTETAPLELDIRGHNAEEGIMAMDLYLDNAFLSSLPSVQIIHGKGSGVLRTAVHRYLKKHPHVKSFRLGKYGEGEDGVTVVSLK